VKFLRRMLIDTPCPWYHCWNPQSGLLGGLMMGTLLCIVIVLAFILVRS